jgi:hypothetical protein
MAGKKEKKYKNKVKFRGLTPTASSHPAASKSLFEFLKVF